MIDAAPKIGELYNSYCLSCHGTDMEGGSAPSMLDDDWRYGRDDAVLADDTARRAKTSSFTEEDVVSALTDRLKAFLDKSG